MERRESCQVFVVAGRMGIDSLSDTFCPLPPGTGLYPNEAKITVL